MLKCLINPKILSEYGHFGTFGKVAADMNVWQEHLSISILGFDKLPWFETFQL